MSAPAVPRIQRMPLQSSSKATPSGAATATPAAAAPRGKMAVKSAATPRNAPAAATTTPRPTTPRPTTPRLATTSATPAAPAAAPAAASKAKKPSSKPASASTTPRSSKAREQSPPQSEPLPHQPSAGTPAKRTPRKKSTTPGKHASKPETYVPKDDALDDACLHCPADERTSGMLYRAIAVDRHDKSAIFNLGWMHYFGSGGCTRNEKSAWSYFNAAAHQGHAMGHYYCGLMKERGLGGQAMNVESALEHYLFASHEGCDLGSYAAARLSEQLGLESREHILELYETAAAQGSGQAEAKVRLLRASTSTR